MTLQNRVRPTGEIVAEPWRGALMGNRGRLHGPDARLGTARWASWAWVACRLDFKGRRRAPMPPGRYTALFFWDEACALAAGHRPCGECRRADHLRFRDAWAAAGLAGASARDIDRVLQAARVGRDRAQIRAEAAAEELPEGAMILDPEDAAPLLLWEGAALAWSPAGYAPRRRPSGRVRLLTPRPTVAALAAGYRPELRRSP